MDVEHVVEPCVESHQGDNALGVGGLAPAGDCDGAGIGLGRIGERCRRAGVQAVGDLERYRDIDGVFAACRVGSGVAALGRHAHDGVAKAHITSSDLIADGEVVAIGDDHHRDKRGHIGPDRVHVERDQQIALGDCLPLAGMQREAGALQVDRVDTDMDEQFGAVLGTHGQRVARRLK